MKILYWIITIVVFVLGVLFFAPVLIAILFIFGSLMWKN